MRDLTAAISGLINARLLYPAAHPQVMEGSERVVSILDQTLAETSNESVTFLVVGNDLVIDGKVLRQGSLTEKQFVDLLTKRGVERLTLARGLEPGEVLELSNALAESRKPVSSGHIVVGHVHIPLDDSDEIVTDEELLEQVETVREAFSKFRTERKLPMKQIEEMIRSLLASLKMSARSTLTLAPLKEHDEYTFVHSVNVSLLVMAQARSFRLDEDHVHAFGTAALLHDIGKLTIPHRILNCPGKLEGEDWEIMMAHAEQGARLLSDQEESPSLSILVAYEHHLRYDGEPNYPIPPRPRYPNLASRMTAVADAFDAMSTIRPYQKPLMRSKAMEILRNRAGSFYDPLLVSNFLRIVEESEKAAAPAAEQSIFS